mmetsp:Transcript_12408/g.22419  ORF Transcript_12408/g.22419 Transcript_12408/m.22419 type:complete len:81 (+) Transcript_12408:157-399(+)
MSVALRKFRKLDFSGTTTPPILGYAQKATKLITPENVRALSGWGLCAGLTIFWFIEPYNVMRENLGWTFGPFKAPEPESE